MAIARIGANGGKMDEDRKSEPGSPLDVKGEGLGTSTSEIVEEVWKFRDEHARKLNYDLNAICADLMDKQKRSGHPLVRREWSGAVVREESVEYKTESGR